MIRVYTLPAGKEVRACLDTIHEVGRRGAILRPCTLLAGLRGQLGAAAAEELLTTLGAAGAIIIDPDDGVRLTGLGERLRVDVHGVWGLAESIIAIDGLGADAANDVGHPSEREGHA